MTYTRHFAPYTLLRQRLDAIVLGEVDPAPGASNSAILEKTMAALVSGEPLPKDPYGGGLVKMIEVSFKELFEARDSGRFGALQGQVK